jgi:hypothetical protein
LPASPHSLSLPPPKMTSFPRRRERSFPARNNGARDEQQPTTPAMEGGDPAIDLL